MLHICQASEKHDNANVLLCTKSALAIKRLPYGQRTVADLPMVLLLRSI